MVANRKDRRANAAGRVSFYEPLESRRMLCYEPQVGPLQPPAHLDALIAPVQRQIPKVVSAVQGRGAPEGGAAFNIVWTNRALASDNFTDTFGANAGAARAVVDAVIQQYERIISSMNWTGGATQYSVNISMRSQAAPDFGGQCPPNQVVLDASGAPTGATIFLGRGNDIDSDGLGDGNGWYLDPTPNDWAEFPNVVNAFVGTADGGSPIANQRDFYSLIAHEMGHAMGMTSQTGSNWRTFLGAFSVDSGVADAGGAGNLWAYSSAAVGRVVLTDSDLNGQGVIGVHSAVPGQSFNFNGQVYTSAADVMNNTFQGINGRRLLISNLLIGTIDDVSGYDNVWPEQFGSMYTSLDTTTGQLTLRGGAGNSADTLSVLETAGGYQITVNIGTDVAGTGPTDAFVSNWTDAQVSSIIIDAGGGDDTIEIRTLGSGEPVTIDAGTGNDEVRLAIGDFDSDLLSNIDVDGGTGTDLIWVNDLTDGAGSDTYTLAANSFSKPSRTVTFSGIEDFDLNGSDNNDVYNINSFTGTLSVDGQDGDDTFNITQPGGDLDALDGRATLLGGLGVDSMNLYDTSDTGADPYLFDSSAGDNTNFAKPGGGGAFDGMLYSSMQNIVLEANGSSNAITVDQIFATSATLRGNGGNDALALGGGNVALNVSAIDLRFEGGAGTDSMTINDASAAGSDTHVFDRTLFESTYSKAGDALTVHYVGLEQLTLDASNANNTVNVNGLPSGAPLTINGHLGSDVAQIGGGDIGSNVLADVTFNATFNGRAVFNDSTNPSVANVYNLDGASFAHAGRTHTFVNVTDVEIEGSDNGDQINVEDTFGYDTVIRGNGGTDLITLGGGSMAFMQNVTVYGGDGADELRLDDTSAFAAATFTADQGAGLPFVDAFNGSIRTTYDSIDTLRIMAGPQADTITSIRVPMSLSLRITGNGGADTIDVQGHPTLNSSLFQPVIVDGGAGLDTVQINTDGQGGARAEFLTSQDLDTLAIGTSGHLALGTGHRVIDVVNGVTLPASGFELDLSDGFFVRRGNPSFPFYRDRIAVGYNAGAWDGLGINSSTAAASAVGDGLGIARASDLFNGGGGIVAGINLAANDIIIRHTLYGDCNLDGTVNLLDFNRLSGSFGAANTSWSQGNFNYDNSTNLLDFNALAANFGQSII
jgi:hypothetical protein